MKTFKVSNDGITSIYTCRFLWALNKDTNCFSNTLFTEYKSHLISLRVSPVNLKKFKISVYLDGMTWSYSGEKLLDVENEAVKIIDDYLNGKKIRKERNKEEEVSNEMD